MNCNRWCGIFVLMGVVGLAGGRGMESEATGWYAVSSSGTGLTGEYFQRRDLTSLVLTRVDPSVDFNWGSGSPAAGIGTDDFSIRWTGQVEPRYSEQYTFYTLSDDGVRLWVNGQLIIDNWTSHTQTEDQGSITLVAGQRHAIKMEYYERRKQAVARLSWSSASQVKEVIPQSQLYPTGTPPPPSEGGWLYTEGNHIYTAEGTIWHGRGANLHDTRSCNACTWSPPNVDEVKRRVDELVDVWHANFIRLVLESYASAEGRVHYQGILDDPAYLADIVEIVRHIGTKPGVYVMVSLWDDPTFSSLGWPTAQTIEIWEQLAYTFRNDSNVLFGLVNEPQWNFDGALDADVWQAMNDTVAAIRAVESAAGTPSHLIAVQGTRAWARYLGYYVTHPITAGGGQNIVYETHIYDPAAEFQELLVEPAQTLPVIIGEFGPSQMTLQDCVTLMDLAEQLEVPYTAWTFHMRCPPNLLVDYTNHANYTNSGCGVGMSLVPTTPWGQTLKNRLAQPW